MSAALLLNNVTTDANCIFQEKQEREEEMKKTRLQVYVFICRCIAYPFNAKQPTDMTKRHLKITKSQLDTIHTRFQARRHFTRYHHQSCMIIC